MLKLTRTCLERLTLLYAFCALVVFAFAANALAQEPYQRLVRRFEMAELGITHPAGLVYSAAVNALLVSPAPDTTALITVTFAPDLEDTITVAFAISDPSNMTFDNKANSLLFLDTIAEELVEITARVNGPPSPSPDSVIRYNAKPYSSPHIHGLTLDAVSGNLFVLVAPAPPETAKILRIIPCDSPRFDGPKAATEGRIITTKLTALPAVQLGGIAFNPNDGHLYVVSPTERQLFEVTLGGELVSTRDLSGFEDIGHTELSDIRNITFAPSGDQTDDPELYNLYFADTGFNSFYGRGDLFELSLIRPEQFKFQGISINDVTVAEGDAGSTGIVFDVTLTGPSEQEITVAYATMDGTAGAGSDYGFTAGTLTFTAGDTVEQITVEIFGDANMEASESFFVNLVNPRGLAYLADSQAVGTILNDDAGILLVPDSYPTVSAALAVSTAGDTILLAPGIYRESIEITTPVVLASWFITSGDTSYIAQTILEGDEENAVVSISRASEIAQITGLTIRNGTDGISARGKFNINNCRVLDNGDGIDFGNRSGGLCSFNLFAGNSDDGIDCDNAVDVIIENNIIRNNGDDGIEIRLQPHDGKLLSYILRDNLIFANDEDGIQLVDYDSLSNRFFIIERNVVFNNRMAGLGCMSGGNTREDYQGAGLLERIYLFNNTFVANDYGVTGGDSLVALNNIFVNHPGTAMKNVDGGSIVAYSLYWGNGLQFASCNVDSSLVFAADPLLRDNYFLQPGSPAIDRGAAFFTWQGDTVLNLPVGSFTGTAPDLGAYEFTDVDTPTNVPDNTIPTVFHLAQNFPNPFNPSTRISYALSFADIVELTIYDMTGRQVTTLFNEYQAAGSHSIEFQADKYPSGVYFYSLRTKAGQAVTKKMLLLK